MSHFLIFCLVNVCNLIECQKQKFKQCVISKQNIKELTEFGVNFAEPWQNTGSSPPQEKKHVNKHLIVWTRWFSIKSQYFIHLQATSKQQLSTNWKFHIPDLKVNHKSPQCSFHRGSPSPLLGGDPWPASWPLWWPGKAWCLCWASHKVASSVKTHWNSVGPPKILLLIVVNWWYLAGFLSPLLQEGVKLPGRCPWRTKRQGFLVWELFEKSNFNISLLIVGWEPLGQWCGPGNLCHPIQVKACHTWIEKQLDNLMKHNCNQVGHGQVPYQAKPEESFRDNQ